MPPFFILHGVTYSLVSEIVGIYDDFDTAMFMFSLCKTNVLIGMKFLSLSVSECQEIEEIENELNKSMERWK